MPGQFEMDPSPYHLGTCNVLVPDGAVFRPCGAPAIRRVLGLAAMEVGGDVRRCREHAGQLLPWRSGLDPPPG